MNIGRLGVGEDHEALHDAVRGWTSRHVPPAVPRAWLDDDGLTPARPPMWDDLAAAGWLGVHLPESVGGQGGGLPELGVVLEELGRACTPGPLVSTVLASAALHRLGADAATGDLASGASCAAVAWGTDLGTVDAAGGVSGRFAVVPGAPTADVLLVPVGSGRWALVDASANGVDITARPGVDRTRPLGDVSLDSAPSFVVLDDPDGAVDSLAARLWSADALGVATWCVETAAGYAVMREQFGRPIGQFQAVKHRCADMLLTLERARAAVWDALQCEPGPEEALASSVAAALAPDAALRCAKDCVQVLGGVGFTWEHDAHLYLKRALGIRAVVGPASHSRARVVELAKTGARRMMRVELPPEAEPFRAGVRVFLDDLKTTPKEAWRVALADGGWITPHWPVPWGRGAGAVEQLVIDEEFAAARVRRPHLAVGAWVLPTLISHGTTAQQERFMPPTLRGELSWCQLFSEPGAGSDLASLSTKASRVDGGWLLSGQKVWTSMAADADWGICLARTDPTVPKHEGITCFLVDMRAEGIDVRPLRELTGAAMFNEVFLSDVFVGDDCVVGVPGGGWSAGRTTLANERVSMGQGSSFGFGLEMVLGLLDPSDAVAADEVGELLVEAQALAVLGVRMTLRSLHGAEPGPESSVRKLLGVEHEQRVQEVGLGLVGRAGAAEDGDAAGWIAGFLSNRCLTIAGGTSEIQRNVIAERLLGLPKDSV